jgi:hypothetical protein
LCATCPRLETSYALEGTFAHELAEICLKKGRDAAHYLNWWLFRKDNEEGRPIFLQRNFPEGDVTFHKIKEPMVWAVQEYLDTIRADETKGTEMGVEVGFHLDWLDEDLWGTNDCNLGQRWGIIRCYDYKNGQGHAVDIAEPATPEIIDAGEEFIYWIDEDTPVVPNHQLMYYLVGAIGEGNPNEYDEAEIVIVQPHADHRDGPVRRLRMPVEEVFRWVDEYLMPAVRRAKDEDFLRAGDWCIFCDAKVKCPEKLESIHRVTQHVFKDTTKVKTLPEPGAMTDAMLDDVVTHANEVTSWIKKCVTFLQAKLERGDLSDRYKLVNKKSARSYINPDNAERTMKALLGDAIYAPKEMRSVAQMEKLVKARKLDPTTFNKLWTKASTGLTIVPKSDPRPAALPTNNNPFKPIDKEK